MPDDNVHAQQANYRTVNLLVSWYCLYISLNSKALYHTKSVDSAVYCTSEFFFDLLLNCSFCLLYYCMPRRQIETFTWYALSLDCYYSCVKCVKWWWYHALVWCMSDVFVLCMSRTAEVQVCCDWITCSIVHLFLPSVSSMLLVGWLTKHTG